MNVPLFFVVSHYESLLPPLALSDGPGRCIEGLGGYLRYDHFLKFIFFASSESNVKSPLMSASFFF